MIARARWVLPIHRPPIDGGWVEIASGRVARVGRGAPPGPSEDLGDHALLPGLVNAHAHLELSWMAGRILPSASMTEWIRALLALRREGPAAAGAITRAMQDAVASMIRTGTVLVGDISNTLESAPLLAQSGLEAVVFHELLGFRETAPDSLVREAQERIRAARAAHPSLRFTLCAHAPYSVSPALLTAIARAVPHGPLPIHLAESPDEVEFLRTGSGPMRRLLEDLDVWTAEWRAPGGDPIQYVASLGYLRKGTLAVHAVHVTDDGLERLRQAGGVIVTCPRSNEWVGAGPPRVARFYGAGIPVAVGTDSLASAPTLNLFDELAELRRLAPEVSAAALLDSATRQGARALGAGDRFGTLEPGKAGRVIGVAIPPGERDVEEYLVSGVPESAVRLVA
jgi:cytosine/adenosine deaminase-related metal-dependent hydrolase